MLCMSFERFGWYRGLERFVCGFRGRHGRGGGRKFENGGKWSEPLSVLMDVRVV